MVVTSSETPPIGEAVDVLVDGSGRLGALSYRVPPGLVVAPGDAVHVPFGKRELHGVVLGPSADPSKATRDILSVFGSRVSPLDLDLARELATEHFTDFPQIAARLSPRNGRGAEPLDAGSVDLTPGSTVVLPEPPRNLRRRLYLRAPLVDVTRLTAFEAARLSEAGQVLILCPTVALVERVLAEFDSGAARLDSRARAGAWRGFREGTVTIGIGTRAAALYSAHRLAGIIVVEPDHPGHLESQLPYTHARHIASMRADIHKCALTLISASPSASSMGAKLKVLQAGSNRDWPSVRVVDRNRVAPSDRLVPPLLRNALDKAAADGLDVVALAESRPARRICARCSTSRPCDRCSSSLCRHVERDGCTKCGDTGVRIVGWDVARVTKTLGVPAMTLTEIENLPAAQRLVVVFDLDSVLNAPALDAEHASAQVMMAALEAAGRGGRVVVCTSQPDRPVFTLLHSRDLVGFAKRTWDWARAAALPPFSRLVTLRLGWAKPPRVANWPGQVHGPRRRGDEWEILVRVSEEQLVELRPLIEKVRRRGKSRVWVS